MTALMDMSDMFIGMPDTVEPTLYVPRMTIRLKREVRVTRCLWCNRKCRDLFYNMGCTYECVVTYLYHTNRTRLDVVFVEVGKKRPYVSKGLYPVLLPPKTEGQTDRTYWEQHGSHVYRNDDPRYTAFMNRFKVYSITELTAEPSKRSKYAH